MVAQRRGMKYTEDSQNMMSSYQQNVSWRAELLPMNWAKNVYSRIYHWLRFQ